MHITKMTLKFAANLNFLFTEAATIADRIGLAHKAGFKAVEIPFPRNEEIKVIEAVNTTGIIVALMNIALGDNDLRLGSSSIPGAEQAFKEQLSDTVNLAKRVNCSKIHLMSGLMTSNTFEKHLTTYTENLMYAAGILEKENIVGLIEPINKYSVPSYFMNSYDVAEKVLATVNSTNIKLMLDIFHLQQIRGNIANSIKELAPIIGHIQIAQVPNRNEPDVAGELNYEFVFRLIQEWGYNGWIGCEYKPKTSTVEGLKWLSNYGYQL